MALLKINYLSPSGTEWYMIVSPDELDDAIMELEADDNYVVDYERYEGDN